MSAEERLALEPHDTTTPELEFERAWARELLRQAVERLEAAYRTAGNSAVFHALRDHLTDGSGETGYDRIASGLGISEPAARFAAFKLRQRYRQTLRDLIRDTVANLDEVESEVTHLRALF
jgi:RNA polymerase sigma-70 factor (ECF subfamily)